MKIFKTVMLILLTFIVSCKLETKHKIEVQGHRGERGHLPENSIEGFLGALHKGVDVIELDVIISKDHQVVVSHEPYMSSLYITKPSGDPILKSEEKSYNLYQMTYDSIKKFDGGSRGHQNFPNQKQMKTYKPLLSEVFDVIEKEIKTQKLPSVKYNIEIKSNEGAYDIYQPQPDVFVNLVMQVIQEKQMVAKVNIQSFDPTVLNILHEKHPEIEIAFLVSKGSIQNNLKLLAFKPQIYSPNFKLIKNKTMVDSLKVIHIKVIPWTVNTEEDIKTMIDLQVDAIISDYPERALELLD
ncbi:glycerophosphodiester phosphodiesterase family protein [Mariniflexile ostreae]|uniref:Glycerophosphodiester phosphodiesterase family protein n=1 Tax=Mariniflexile ostreae TaxID=1520892 RepID=A0ABV5F8A4_9FLAO